MPPELPDCDRCKTPKSLEVIRTSQEGDRWVYCTCCGKTMLLNASGGIVSRGN